MVDLYHSAAIFDETSFPFFSRVLNLLHYQLPFFSPHIVMTTPLPMESTVTTPSTTTPCDLCSTHDPTPLEPPVHSPHASPVPTPTISHVSTPPSTPSSSLLPSSPPDVGHHMVTRDKDGIFKPLLLADLSYSATSALYQALFALKEPKGFKSASKDPKWFATICEEMKALHQNSTWELILRPSCSNIVGSKWVFCTIFHVDGSIDKYKVCLVA